MDDCPYNLRHRPHPDHARMLSDWEHLQTTMRNVLDPALGHVEIGAVEWDYMLAGSSTSFFFSNDNTSPNFKGPKPKEC